MIVTLLDVYYIFKNIFLNNNQIKSPSGTSVKTKGS